MGRKLKHILNSIAMGNKLDSELLLYNDAVSIVHDATKLCWDKPAENTYNGKKDFIRRRIATGHESILEHSNLVILLTVSKDYVNDILGCNFHYLNVVTKFDEKNGVYYVLIGGSIRGYKHLFKKQRDQNNVVCKLVKNELYNICPREFFIDLIEDGIFKDNFTDIMSTKVEEFDPEKEDYSEKHKINAIDENKIWINNFDDISTIYTQKLADKGFYLDELLVMCTVSIQFKEMSRIITQQLTRHRNAITQASGRYIDVGGNVEFNAPDLFKEKYKDQTYKINVGTQEYVGITLSQIADLWLPVYKQLRDQGLDKEDARSYLLMNCQCGDVYMTFTYESLLQFLKLRTHTSAQAEIRQYANIIYDSLIGILTEKLHVKQENLYKYLEPVYKITYDETIEEMTEEVISENIETIEEDTNNES